jgi:osmotically inducible protein OsmC
MRTSVGVWTGTLKNGKGTMQIGHNGIELDYSFPSRFEGGIGTNPEELLGAAHAGCYSMALSLFIAEAGFTPSNIRTVATVHLEKDEDGFTISQIELDTTADVPGMDSRMFLEQAEKAKNGCPVSRALTGVEITLKAKLKKDT